ncbi:RNA polymerase sigma-70 factor [Amycolatopsis aidingensis]|uniref:RNA polymerase sigma-70 factor n=1 Tax=Amycolatopsis aidingensis TaxID=2842453 RepID=UPI001C0B8319|nr:RNA polymerase sigma-70 factor [Amycolatopsis aidingensis]
MATSGSVREFEDQRPRLLGLAYRLLGSATEAEDAVQDAFLRWDQADRASIGTPSAWLAKVVTNLCLNRLTSARARRERYLGPWLPEPVRTTDGALGPLDTVEQRDSVSMALLVLLERLGPAERAVFVLREAFGYGHREIAEIVELSESNCRQLYRRARQRLAEAGGQAPAPPDRTRWQGFVERFLAAAREGDLSGLEQLLAEDVTSWADGGGKVHAARKPIHGRERVAQYLLRGLSRYVQGFELRMTEVNDQPALVSVADGTVQGVLLLEVAGDHIVTLRTIANPDKLTFLTRQLL